MGRNLPMRSTTNMSSRSRHIRKWLGNITCYRRKKGSTEETNVKSSSRNARGAKGEAEKGAGKGAPVCHLCKFL